MVETIAFDSGRPVRAGDVLVRLDTRQEQAQLAAAEAQRDLAQLNLERMRGLRGAGRRRPRRSYDRADAEHKQAEARVGEIRATIERKTIRAPFAGVLGIRQVNLGQYLNARRPDRPAAVARSDLRRTSRCRSRSSAQLRVGARGAASTAEGLRATPSPGTITRRSTRSSTRRRATSRSRRRFANRDGRLRPGMFVEAQVRSAAPARGHRAAGLGDQLRALRRLGLRRRAR